MGIDQLEIWVHDHILKNDTIRHFCYGVYQRVLYLLSPKFQCEGDITVVTPDDGYEYLFGYYDKCPWSPNGRYLLALKVKSASAEADSAVPADIVRIDLQRGNACEHLATTHCWNVQQGCMAQWLDDTHVLYNDFRNGKYCAVVLDLCDRSERVLEKAVYTVSADGSTALTLDFARLHRLRPGYGYSNLADGTKEKLCPEETCVWKMDLRSGEVMPLFSYAELAEFESRPDMEGAEHKVNHLMISPNGKRFMMLHRWFKNKKKYTRLLTCDMEGNEWYNLSDDDFVSHCCWKNDDEIISYLNKIDGGKGYYHLTDRTQNCERLWPALAMDGHPSFSPDGSLVVTDTYPDRRRIQSLYVMKGKRMKRIVRVFSPFRYSGDTRCDLHPRWSRDGTQICFDAAFRGKRCICVADADKVFGEKRTVLHQQRELAAPVASIIIPCYNAQKFLEDTLEGLENQTRQDFEVICINDGSKDETLSILKAWQKKGTLDLRIIDKENGGVSAARNDGLKAAQGKYVMFLDADDAYNELFVEQLVGAIEETEADVAYCRLDRKYENVLAADFKAVAPIKETQKDAMDHLLYRMGEFGFYCYVYRRDVLAQNNIEFDCHTKFGEDREFNWKYLCHCRNAVFVDLPLYWYRINQQSVTQAKASWRKTDLLIAVKRIEAYMQTQNCTYLGEFRSYMYARAMWAVAKNFAASGDRALLQRLGEEYDVKTCMKRTARDKNMLVALASWMYLVHPMLFYYVVRLRK